MASHTQPATHPACHTTQLNSQPVPHSKLVKQPSSTASQFNTASLSTGLDTPSQAVCQLAIKRLSFCIWGPAETFNPAYSQVLQGWKEALLLTQIWILQRNPKLSGLKSYRGGKKLSWWQWTLQRNTKLSGSKSYRGEKELSWKHSGLCWESLNYLDKKATHLDQCWQGLCE